MLFRSASESCTFRIGYVFFAPLRKAIRYKCKRRFRIIILQKIALKIAAKIASVNRPLRPYSKSKSSLTLKFQWVIYEWKFNVSFSRVSLLFLNSWRVSVIYLTMWLLTLQLFKNSIDTQGNGHLHNRLNWSRKKFHHSLKEHHKISNIPKFRCEML
jgi:hypothetical protein